MNVVIGTTKLVMNVTLTYEDASAVDITELLACELWVRSGRGRYRGTYAFVTDGTDGYVTFDLDYQDLSTREQVSYQFEVKTPAGAVIWTEAEVIKLVPRS